MSYRTPVIDSFRGEYRWLSNLWLCTIPYYTHEFPSVENAYQYAKSFTRPEEFTTISPGEAKRLGRKIPATKDWEDRKLNVMETLLRMKFAAHDGLREKLLKTGDTKLVEGNTWGDTFWGVCNGKGSNHLGRLLMLIREEYVA